MRMTSKKKLLAVSLLAAVAAGVQAEGPNVSGFVDVGYNYNPNGELSNLYRSFDNMSNTITLQNAKLGVDGSIDSNTLQQAVIGFVFSNEGLMYNLTLEGTRITRIAR